MSTTPGGAAAASKTVPAAPDQIEAQFHAPSGNVAFTAEIISGRGSVAFSAFTVDGQKQTLNTPLTAQLQSGEHEVGFTLAFSGSPAIAVLQSASNPPTDLVLIDSHEPFKALKVIVP